MKYLKYLLGLILVLTFIVVGRGLLTPSVTYSSEITVDKSIEEAWAVMNDESKVSEWLKGITKVEHVSGEKGKIGAVTRYTFNQDGQESTILETLKEIRPNEHVAMDFKMEDVMDMDYQVDFSSKNGKTHIKSSTITTGSNFPMRCMLSFMQGGMQTQEDENMANLKALIEKNTTNYFPAPVAEEVMEIKE